MQEEKLTLSVVEAARLAGVSSRTIWAHLAPHGTLRPTRIGRRVVILRDELERWLRERTAEPATDPPREP